MAKPINPPPTTTTFFIQQQPAQRILPKVLLPVPDATAQVRRGGKKKRRILALAAASYVDPIQIDSWGMVFYDFDHPCFKLLTLASHDLDGVVTGKFDFRGLLLHIGYRLSYPGIAPATS